MARAFAAASSQYGEYAGADVSGYPFSIYGKFYPLDTLTVETFWSIATNGSDNHYFEVGPNAADKIRFRARDTANNDVTTANSFTQNAWNDFIAIGASAIDRRITLNNGTQATTTNSKTPAGMNRTTLGRKPTATNIQYFNGRLAEFVTWNVVLDANEQAAISKGISPLEIRPASIVTIRRCWGNESPEPEYRNRNELVLSGAPTHADHPLVFY